MDTVFEPVGLGAIIFRDRYARSPEETWEEGCHRVAEHVAQAESNGNIKKYTERFEQQLVSNKFNPGGRIWYGAGRPKAQLLNCFVIPTSDSREGWGRTTSDTIVISGLMGGVGMNVSPVRPRGSLVKGTGGVATGAVSFMQLINGIGDVIAGGGGRRMALMLALNVNHPDLEEFLSAKLDRDELNNANVSVIIPSDMDSNDFVAMVEAGTEFELMFNGIPSGKTVNARELWDKLVRNAWESGEPGVLNGFYANKMNNIWYHKPLICTNPSMPAGTLVATREGIFPIERLEGKAFDVKSLDGTWAKAECWLSGENEEVLEIDLGGGKITHSTKQHRWPVWDKRMGRVYKVYADELKPGDLIPLNRPERPGIQGDMDLTRDEGFLLGVMTGDGWISQRSNGQYAGGIVFSANEMVVAEKVLAIVNSKKENPSTITTGPRGEKYIQFTDQGFLQYLIKTLGVQTDKSLGIPEIVFTSNDEFIEGFVDGMITTDGWVSANENNMVVTLTSSKEKLATDFGKLLSFFGINVSICHATGKANFPNGNDYEGKIYHRWDVRMSRAQALRFYTMFDITHPEKAAKLATLAEKTFRIDIRSNFACVESIRLLSERAPVWDISVQHNQHVFPSQWCYTGNCGEIWLEEYGCCDLGSLVLPRFVENGQFDWDALDETVRVAVRFLDNVLDVNHYPLAEIKENCENVRRIGLGVMGLHTMLLELGMTYDSDEAFAFVDKLFSVIKNTAYDASINLAIEKGPFPAYDPQFLDSGFAKTLKRGIRNKIREHGIRNCALLMVAPTGTTSLMSGVTSGLEPVPAIVYWRNFYKPTADGRRELTQELVVEEMYHKYPDLIQSAIDIPVEAHFRMQKVVQHHVDNAVSKTINLAQDYPQDEFGDVWLKYLPFLKGTTVYRFGSRENEPIQPIPREQWQGVMGKDSSSDTLSVDEFMALDCPDGVCDISEMVKS